MDTEQIPEDEDQKVIEILDLEPADIPHGCIVLEK